MMVRNPLISLAVRYANWKIARRQKKYENRVCSVPKLYKFSAQYPHRKSNITWKWDTGIFLDMEKKDNYLAMIETKDTQYWVAFTGCLSELVGFISVLHEGLLANSIQPTVNYSIVSPYFNQTVFDNYITATKYFDKPVLQLSTILALLGYQSVTKYQISNGFKQVGPIKIPCEETYAIIPSVKLSHFYDS